MEKQEEPRVMSDRTLRTVCLYVCFGMLGLASPLLGNTAVHLERLFEVNTATMSLTFTLHMAGYMTGSVVCGFIYDRVDHELAFAAANLLQGFATILAPFLGGISGLPAFIAVMFIQALPQGFIDAGGQSYCVSLWAGHRFCGPILQASHSMWSLGGMVGPLITAQFLVELPHSGPWDLPSGNEGFTTAVFEANENCTSSGGHESSSGQPIASNDFANTSALLPANTAGGVDVSRVRFAFVAHGSLILFAGVLFTIAYFRGHSKRVRSVAGSDEAGELGDSTKTDLLKGQSKLNGNSMDTASAGKKALVDRSIFLIFCLLTFLFNNLYTCVQLIPTQFLTTFAVKFLGFPISEASLLMSVYFGMLFAGSIVGIPVSAFLRPRTTLIINMSLTVVSYLLMLVYIDVSTIMWVSVALAGFSVATTFTNGILWTAEAIPVTGFVASVMVFGYAVGGMVGPMFVGRLFESSTPMWFVYVLVSSSISHVVLFLCLMTFVHRFTDNLKRATLIDQANDESVRTTSAVAENQLVLVRNVFQSTTMLDNEFIFRDCDLKLLACLKETIV